MMKPARLTPLTAAIAAVVLAGGSAASQRPRFLADAPVTRWPDSQDASGVRPWDINLAYDLAHAYTVTASRRPERVHAKNVNTVDEVPDSSWFTNRIGSRPLSLAEIRTGPVEHPPPATGTWTLLREKSAGFAAGFTARDSAGATWFVSFDAPGNPDGASAALVVATKLFWALGYNQVEYHLAPLRRADIRIDPKATMRRPSGRRTPLSSDDLAAVLERARPRADGSYRIAAGRLLPGRILGGFKYEGTRPDDPNDLVPHQHRRELRALRVFGAWTNLTDMKAGNTLDTVVGEGRAARVRHYLQDVGSTFGVGAAGPHDWSEGWEYVLQAGPALRRLFSLGFALSPWQVVPVVDHPSIGRFEGEAFDPLTWKPRAPVAAYNEMRDDDAFWAARKVMAFSDEAIRAAVASGEFSDPRAAELLAGVLIARRDRIGRAYLPRINPIVDPALDAGGIRFGNAAVDHRVATAPRRYLAQWFDFDNATGAVRDLGVTSADGPALAAPPGLADAGPFVRVDLWAEHPGQPTWSRPIVVHFRRMAAGWTPVGLVRQP